MLQLMRLGRAERVIRVAAGAGLLAYFAFFPHATWALLGLVPLLTGLVNACPFYGLCRRPATAAAGDGPLLAAAESAGEPAPEPAVRPAREPQPLHRTRKKVKRQSSGRPRAGASSSAEPGKVGHVTDGTFQSQVLSASPPVLVDFWAEWCGPCKAMAPILAEVAAEVSGSARVLKLDVEHSPVTAQRLGIRNIPTLILFQGGETKDVLVGMQSKEKLVRLLRRAAERAAA